MYSLVSKIIWIVPFFHTIFIGYMGQDWSLRGTYSIGEFLFSFLFYFILLCFAKKTNMNNSNSCCKGSLKF